jgi:endo-1,4-beta-xylanase
VDRIAERYGDIFYRIDVANELFLGDLTEDTVDPYGFRKGTWWHAAGGADGPQWVDRFFHYVRRAFPSAKLVVNEFGIEAESAQHRRKRAALLAWLKGAKARGCPVDGVGLQSHLMAAAPYDTPGMRAFCRDVKSLGLAVHITELDVNGLRLPTTLSRHERNRITAQYARHHVTVLADHADLAEITWWGLRSDLNHTAKRHRHERRLEPSPFDAESRPLPMYDAVCQALEDTA